MEKVRIFLEFCGMFGEVTLQRIFIFIAQRFCEDLDKINTMGKGERVKVAATKAAPKRKPLPKIGGRNNSTYAGQTFLLPGVKLPHCPYSKKTQAAVVTPSKITHPLEMKTSNY